ncbi:RNA polymerase sigma-70 factor, ECF subfamily [Algoriphagus alkaliphilus]|uniref:RNA polymerase sigma-70 factor, ECF subfamily n=1 Tax=Algoriphagus alkaliphilus TaxID=279824 RepID=A0A1G5W5B9_9BACT|nr:sigma-70 family RNA polymerase sigma factor [Algoriphagus alkaliphilus]MBA4300525.1 sigma-70 family RNA polymerase sigma factor [Cyclobacterium sp.]SDA53309.1 RNA polymerase sigma-70 factor, ECF subfamily [Algoriphagus alkaliphilus]
MNREDEFIYLIQQNQGLIYKITTIYTRDREEQKDLYQEIVYQTWKSFDQFKKASKPSTWLYRVGMNTAITNLNRSKKRVTAVPMEGLELDFAEDLDSGLEERLKVLYAEIRKLGLLDRGIVFLFLEGKSHDEIAEIVGISSSNVGTRLSRIKDKLRKGVQTY